MVRKVGLACWFLLTLTTTSVLAQDSDVVLQLYSSGVHAYFSGEYREAFGHLNAAVELGTVDPRVYYFRGLCYMELGREEEAKMDFEKAAELEVSDIGGIYNVSQALERIQGKTRLLIESYRARARLEAQKRAKKIQEIRYGQLQAIQQRLIEAQAEQAVSPPATPSQPQPPEQPAVTEPAAPPSPPQPEEQTKPAQEETTPAQPPAPPAGSPFGAAQPPVMPQPAEQPAPVAQQPPGAEAQAEAQPAAPAEQQATETTPTPPKTQGGVLKSLGGAIGSFLPKPSALPLPGSVKLPAAGLPPIGLPPIGPGGQSPAGNVDQLFGPQAGPAPGAQPQQPGANEQTQPAMPPAPADVDQLFGPPAPQAGPQQDQQPAQQNQQQGQEAQQNQQQQQQVPNPFSDNPFE